MRVKAVPYEFTTSFVFTCDDRELHLLGRDELRVLNRACDLEAGPVLRILLAVAERAAALPAKASK